MTYRWITFDCETEFSDTFSLSKMSTEEYVRDPRFKVHGAAIRWSPKEDPIWYDEPRLRYILAQEDWSDVALISWHMNFDGLVLSHHYGVVPKLYVCPMSMARMLHPAHISVSLDNIRRLYGMPLKTTPYSAFKNKKWHELTREVQETLAEGARDEVNSIWELFKIFVKQMPLQELEIIDEIIRMFCQPVLRADVDMLARLWETEETRKQLLLKTLNVDASLLSSTNKFTELLEAEGVEIEYKKGKNNNDIPAFGKNDDFMRELLEHPNDRIRTLAEARLGVKSTLLQTRAETYARMEQRGSLPVYLRYCGASTLRVSGGDGSNWVNQKRNSDLRRAIRAPKGFLLGPVDAAQIECRCLNYLAGQEDMVERFRQGVDPYIGIASQFYREEVYKPKKDDPRKEEMEAKRGTGKQLELSCGYGAAGKAIVKTAKLGIYGPPVNLTLEEGERASKLYRETHAKVCDRHYGYWAQAERMLSRLHDGSTVEWGPLTVKDHKIFLPSGAFMHYDSLEFYVPDDSEECRDFERRGYWRMRTRQGWKKMWGSKLVQNICEAVSRDIVMQAMIRIKRMGIRTLNNPYDELLLLIPDDSKAEETLEICRLEMCRTPSWLPGIPLGADASLGERYSK